MSQTYQRHLSLRVPLEMLTAIEPVSSSWILNRAHGWLDAFTVDGRRGTRIISDRQEWLTVTGYELAEPVWGLVDKARGETVKDDPRTGTRDDPFLLFLDLKRLTISRGFAESVVAHEVTHLRYKSLGHSQQFFNRVQEGIFDLGDPSFRLLGPRVSAILNIVAPKLSGYSVLDLL